VDFLNLILREYGLDPDAWVFTRRPGASSPRSLGWMPLTAHPECRNEDGNWVPSVEVVLTNVE
jgi:hypothetical protein